MQSPRRACAVMTADSLGRSCLRLCSPEGLTSTSGCSLAWIWVICSCPCNAAANPEKEEHRTCSPGNSSLSTRCHWQRGREGRQHNYSHSKRLILLNCPFRGQPSHFFGVSTIKPKKQKNSLVNFKMLQVKANCFPWLLGSLGFYVSHEIFFFFLHWIEAPGPASWGKRGIQGQREEMTSTVSRGNISLRETTAQIKPWRCNLSTHLFLNLVSE